MSKAFEAKSGSDHTRQEVDDYNKAVKEVNAATDTFNKVNNKTNEMRNNLLNSWNEAEKNFFDSHMPYYKK